jgi:IclR family transcriptional regulator, KDG regulon repressor
MENLSIDGVTTIQSISKALDIMEVFLSHPDGLTLTDIAKLSHLKKITVYRIVSTLVKRGYLRQPKKRGNYYLGNTLLQFSNFLNETVPLRNTNIFNLIRICEDLSNVIEAPVTITQRGGMGPLHCTPSGKIHLANMSDEEFNRYVNSKEFIRHTPNSLMDVDTLKNHLKVVQQEGCAYDHEEFFPGMSGAAAELRNEKGEIWGAITVSGLSIRLTRDRLKNITPALKSCAMQISQELGYRK